MIDHISLGVADLDRAVRFYEPVLAALGLARLVSRPATIGFGKSYPEFWLNLRVGMTNVPHESGTHICCARGRPVTSTPSMPLRSRQAAYPTARRACGRMIASNTTRPLSSIPTVTGSRP